MEEAIEIHVAAEQSGARLDKLLADSLPDVSRSRLKALIKEGHVTLAGEAQSLVTPSRTVKPGECYLVSIPPAASAEPLPENIPLTVLYEDSHLLVVDKPAGMVVHPAPGAERGTLVNALLHHCGDSLSGIGGVRRPGIVHRIDKDTSGLLVVAKNDIAHHGLTALFAAHDIDRLYTAVVHGHPAPTAGKIEGAIGRHPHDRKKMAIVTRGGKEAVTHYRTLSHFTNRGVPVGAEVECRLETGRTHQVRVHMTSIGHPLIGDGVYGARRAVSHRLPADLRGAILGFGRQALHARRLGFRHPVTRDLLSFDSPLPVDMARLLTALQTASEQ